jgi:hypothetical protein
LKRPSSFSYHAANGVKSAHQRVGRQPPRAVPRVATGVAKITGHAGLEPAKVDTRMTLSRSDILVENHGSIVLLRPATPAGREWLEANCDPSGHRPFDGGTLLCEPRYVADIVADARQAGPAWRWRDAPPPRQHPRRGAR